MYWSILSNWFVSFGIKVMKCGAIPKHLAIIMDGNRRYAQQVQLERIQGHYKGSDKLDETLKWCLKLGIKEVTVFGFSIDNFKRSPEEVCGLMELLRKQCCKLIDDKEKYKAAGIRVCFIGKLTLLSTDLQQIVSEAMAATQQNKTLLVNIAFSYTGREEITHAISTVISKVKQSSEPPTVNRNSTDHFSNHSRGRPNEVTEVSRRITMPVTEADISSCLYTSPSPFPDLLIRTSGEVRLSDFLTWQTSFCCFYFTDSLWPDFSIWDMLLALLQFQRSFPTLEKIRKSVYMRCTMSEKNTCKMI